MSIFNFHSVCQTIFVVIYFRTLQMIFVLILVLVYENITVTVSKSIVINCPCCYIIINIVEGIWHTEHIRDSFGYNEP